MKRMLLVGALLLGFAFVGQAEAQSGCYAPVVVAPRYDCGSYGYAPAYGYGSYYRPIYRRHHVRYVRPYYSHQPRVAFSFGY